MAKPKKRQFRAEFRKNREVRTRPTGWTRQFQSDSGETDDVIQEERVSGKGDLTRRRTLRSVEGADPSDPGSPAQLDVDLKSCRPGRVLSVHGLVSTVQADDGTLFHCSTRRLLKSVATQERHVVVAGDRVMFLPAAGGEGVIERVEPRRGVLSRAARGRQHVMVANVDQVLIITSAADPDIKPNLIDRFLIHAEQESVPAIVCINKIDLVTPAALQPLVGVYSQMGYAVLLTSARTGSGIERLRRKLAGRQTVLAGQSGVGKSSLLNALDPELSLKVASVSSDTRKGRHTTTTARLWPLSTGGYVVDTPGIRQFQLWDLISREIDGLFRDLRPLANRCAFPDCTHTHEDHCAVKHAVADGWLDARRYESYLHLLEDSASGARG